MSLGTSNRDGGKTSESGHLRALYKAFGSGVISGLNATQRGAGANMSVDVQIGDAIIGRSDDTYGHPSWADAVYNAVITTADGSNPRRDIVVMYIDYNETPDPDVSNNTNGVVKIAVVAGTPAGAPTDPSDPTIQSAVGSGNPFIKLARVRVGTGVTSISNSVIDDLRTMITPTSKPTQDTIRSETMFDHVASGCVITGDSYNSNRNASMTAGVIYLAGKRLTVAAVSARTYTASRDTYVDASDNGDGTAALTYTEVTNNNTSPALASGSIRLGIVVTGASSIVSVASINQGQEDKVLPIASSIPYQVTDSLGNLICPRDPQRRMLGYRQVTGNVSVTATSYGDVTGMSMPVIIPTGRKIKLSVFFGASQNSNSPVGVYTEIAEGTTQLAESRMTAPGNGYQAYGPSVNGIRTHSAGSHTYKLRAKVDANTGTLFASSTAPAYIMAELM